MIDITKNYKTKDGKEVRIYSVADGGEYPVHGAIKQKGGFWHGCWSCTSWTDMGFRVEGTTTSSDLVEVKPTRWVNVYEDYAVTHPSREKADELAASDIRIACVEVKEGDGI